jgi:hypothetical protein
MKVEIRDNGDVVLYAFNGDPLLKLQFAPTCLAVNELVMVNGASRNHPFDCRSEVLTTEAIEAIRGFCEAVQA